jgi:hypothetical protein
LITWLVEDRDKLRQYNSIVRAAKEWDESRRKSDLLVHRDGRLQDATELISERRFEFPLGSVERVYLDACEENQSAREAAVQEERGRRLKDAERLAHSEATRAEEAEKRAKEQKEAASKLRRLVWMLALLVLAAAAAAIFGFWQKGEAVRQGIEAKKEADRAVKAERTATEQTTLAEQQKLEAEKQARVATDAQQTAEKQAVLAWAAENKATEAASEANVFLALNSNAIGNHNQELAYLAKALKLNARNSEASALIAALLTQESWPVVITALKRDDWVNSAQFSSDDQRVVTASEDKTARVWDAATGKALSEPMKHDDVVCSAQFSADGQRVVTASKDNTARGVGRGHRQSNRGIDAARQLGSFRGVQCGRPTGGDGLK